MINPRKISIPQDSVVGGATETSDVDSFVGMLQESNTARKEMKTVLHEILRQPDTIEEMKDLINKLDRDAVKAFWSKFGFTVWTSAVFILGSIVTAFIKKFL
ncbi:MAG: hypothetical protein UW27_C0011G0004 [Parcubacteria group bacterium GW2011_GWA1_44_13]|uniref:Uncharacterized protein n=1 Tax=Candidatus Nomurabacteria bacterium GW2011_GWB1_44_12 TaxID=1618748 RepID=A0A837I6L1_9BACT|nr:MAG: hypothetical protein UW17_C0004G0009 [Candidatus Nomurabacteria bacterium GW2011_GWD1_44_10]KKT36447.1 MAG: hypothetical protein UW25_C0007G0004 [Candidatus Nomurabacteria bacterium GW2011_GWB1_44_12]KKT37682.1 MAG: hypothetical protein UW27_C0011G0004 [Parcubacteria group bacterium GW2011_GWA1_44_13]HBB44204.1 hypothetical protein [Candidatus Yonathbacteria bacterium]